jgi:8-oxo-dGTP pyrophosphatase MutT (NUDIX family)
VTTAPEPHPAATVVLLRPAADSGADAEVLLIHRPTTMAFGPGLHAFPGGRVDPVDASGDGTAEPTLSADAAAAALGGNVPPAAALGLHAAAVREVAEEVGVTLRAADLVPIAHWTTPRFMPRRFSTWFFVADLPPGVEPAFAPDEVAAHRWVSAAVALDQMAAGEIEMWVPTTSVLERLVEVEARSASDVRTRVRMGAAGPPRIVDEGADRVVIEAREAGGLPGRACRTTLVGRLELVVVDPGDPSEPALDAILEAADRRAGTIRAILLTRTDPDHAAGAEALAIPLEVPILVAPGAGRRLPYETEEVADGQTLPTDVDVRVRLDPETLPGVGVLQLVGPSAGE